MHQDKDNMLKAQHPKLTIKQDGKFYDLYNLPRGFVIYGDVKISHKKLIVLPDLSDVIIWGNFDCSGNNLVNLKGAPKEVHGNFCCAHNKLTSLSGAPEIVIDDFDCSHNLLTSLEGAPKYVGADFRCSYNQLTSLSGAPESVGNKFVKTDFDCSHNNLAWLKGAPQTVLGNFDCSHNRLISLEGAPQEVWGAFDCCHNSLESLKGAPARCAFKYHDGLDMMKPAVDFSHNRVTSLQYLPEIPKYCVWFCYDNPLNEKITKVPDYVLARRWYLRGVTNGMLLGLAKELSRQR